MAVRDRLRPRLDAAGDGALLWWGVAAAVCGLGVRVWLAASVGLGDDEAYTWHWSTRLASHYFDHPPLVAWLVSAARAVLGDHALAVRVPALLSHGVLSAAVAIWAGRRSPLRPRAAAGLALVLLEVLPVFAVAGVFVAPDGPLLAAWACVGAWLAADRSLGLRDWLGIGVLAGLAALSKHVGFLLWPGILVALLGSAAGRASLRTAGPWVGLGLAVAVASPTWLGLLQEGTLAFHLTGRPGGPPGLPGTAGLLAGQLVYVGPACVVLCGLARRSGSDAALALPLGLGIVLGSPAVPSLPHWLAPVWLCLLPVASGWLLGHPHWRRVSLLPAGLATALLFVQAGTGVLPLPPATDPTVDLWSWEAVRPSLLEAVQGTGDVVVVTGRYQVAAQAAWALRGTGVPVTRRSGRPDQYDLWRPPGRYAGHRAVVVAHDRYPARPADLGVSGCGAPESKTARRRGATRVFSFWRCPAGQRLK